MPPLSAHWCLPVFIAACAMAAEPMPPPPAESVVDVAKRPFRAELADGSGATADDASLLLAFLAAGYDQSTPSKHRSGIAAGLKRISALEPASLDLPVLALATSALAEAYAMADDEALRPHAERFVGALRSRWPGELPRWLGRTGAFAGPEAVVIVMQALHAGRAGGLPVGDDLAALRAIDLGPGEAAELAGAYRMACDDGRRPYVDLATTERWVASFDRWWKAGRTELILMATFVAYRSGGREWQVLRDSWRERLVALQIRGGADDGRWPLEHHPLGKLHGTAQAMRCLVLLCRADRVEAVKPAGTAPAAAGGF